MTRLCMNGNKLAGTYFLLRLIDGFTSIPRSKETFCTALEELFLSYNHEHFLLRLIGWYIAIPE
jgi:hypothetical protein